MSTIRNSLSRYNDIASNIGEVVLSLSSVLDLNSAIWCAQTVVDASIPAESKHSITQCVLEVMRSNEELHLIKDEVLNTISYYEQKISVIDEAIASIKLNTASAIDKGSVSLLIKLRWASEMLLDKVKFMNKHQSVEYSAGNWVAESSESSSEESDCDL